MLAWLPCAGLALVHRDPSWTGGAKGGWYSSICPFCLQEARSELALRLFCPLSAVTALPTAQLNIRMFCEVMKARPTSFFVSRHRELPCQWVCGQVAPVRQELPFKLL